MLIKILEQRNIFLIYYKIFKDRRFFIENNIYIKI